METIKFGNIAEFRNGLNFSKESHGNGCYIIGVSDFQDRLVPDYDHLSEINPHGIAKEEDYLRRHDIIFVRSNGNKKLVGRSLYINSDIKALFSGFCIRARIFSKKLKPLYCAYYTRTEHFRSQIFSGAGGTNIQNLSQGILSNIHIPCPPIDIQDKIVKVLQNLDRKIEINKKINAELEAMTKSIYDYWFIQFEFPDENGKPYKSSGGKMVWNDILQVDVPVHWGTSSFEEYAEVKKGDLITARDANEGCVKVVAAGIDFSYTHSAANREKNTITISGSGANAGFINFWREPIFASDCITVRGKTDAETILLFQCLKKLQDHILKQATGSAQPHVYPSDIKKLGIAIPPKTTIFEFQKLVLPLNEQIANNLSQNQVLIALRDWLLPMLMNCQVRVAKE